MDNIILMGINVIEKVINSKVQNFGDPCSWYRSPMALEDGPMSNVSSEIQFQIVWDPHLKFLQTSSHKLIASSKIYKLKNVCVWAIQDFYSQSLLALSVPPILAQFIIYNVKKKTNC